MVLVYRWPHTAEMHTLTAQNKCVVKNMHKTTVCDGMIMPN
jgi:hypothetical protein